MDLRRVAPILFVALCLSLSALVLHRQIAAHPMPRAAAAPAEPPGLGGPLYPGQPVEPKTWHVATGPVRREAVATIGNQLAAIRTGNADWAWFYQSNDLHRNFPSAQAFVETITRGYPEFGHARFAAFGPVRVDTTGNHAAVTVTVRGENGHLARGYYRLIREGGGYKVASVDGGKAIN